MKIVGFVGPKRSGKSTAAAALVERRGYVSVGFADAVKDLALRINPDIHDGYGDFACLRLIVEQSGWEEAKEYPEVRRFLEELGTGVRDTVGEDSWINAWWRTVEAQRRLVDYSGLAVPDVRFLNEAEYLRGFNDTDRVLLIRVHRPGYEPAPDAPRSETEQAGIRCDVKLVNDGTPEQLRAEVLDVVDSWGDR